jgi:hypothetical protein
MYEFRTCSRPAPFPETISRLPNHTPEPSHTGNERKDTWKSRGNRPEANEAVYSMLLAAKCKCALLAAGSFASMIPAPAPSLLSPQLCEIFRTAHAKNVAQCTSHPTRYSFKYCGEEMTGGSDTET